MTKRPQPCLTILVDSVAGLDVDTLQVVEHYHHLGPINWSSRWQDPVVRIDWCTNVQCGIGSHLESRVEQDAELGTDQEYIWSK